MQLLSQIIALGGGAAVVADTPEKHTLTFTDTWAEGDHFTIFLNEQETGITHQLGFGNITTKVLTFAMTFGDTVLGLSGATMYRSAIADPVLWNDPNAVGNGYVTLSNQYGTPEDLVACAPYQGYVAFFTRNTIQIWQLPSDPTSWRQIQVLPNLGTFAPLSVQSLGNLDVIFLHSSGVRNLRVRNSSLNAFTEDIGSPINELIVAKLLECTGTEDVDACAIVAPRTSQYWLFIKDTFYVLNYYPQNKIIAWSTYSATDSTGAVFVPQKIVQHEDQIYIVTEDKILIYGGTDKQTYDASPVTVELPWLDDKQPTSGKACTAVDVAITGGWAVQCSQDLIEERFTPLGVFTATTFTRRRVGYNGRGTHFKLKAATTGTGPAKLGSFVLHYESEENR